MVEHVQITSEAISVAVFMDGKAMIVHKMLMTVSEMMAFQDVSTMEHVKTLLGITSVSVQKKELVRLKK